jgi:2-keto-3-deoxy-L-rhamnonate aldolase RhmA
MSEAAGLESVSQNVGTLRRALALKQRLRNGGTIIGAWLGLTDPAAAEILGQVGFDFLMIDTEHCPWNLESLQTAMMALNGADTVPIVRVPWNDHVRIKQVLDLGVEGIMAPMVNTVEECRAFVAACRYPPVGRRGLGPRRASNYYRDIGAYLAIANEAIFVMPQIEHIAAIDVLDDFFAVPGVDAVAIGPNDLSGTVGLLRQLDHPTVTGALDKIIAAGAARDIPVFLGVNTAPSAQQGLVGRGVRILTVTSDVELLAGGGREALRATRAVLGASGQ